MPTIFDCCDCCDALLNEAEKAKGERYGQNLCDPCATEHEVANADTPAPHPYRFEVRFDKVFVDGNLKGLRYPDKIRCATRNSANSHAGQDGYIITPANGSAYRVENSRVVDLKWEIGR